MRSTRLGLTLALAFGAVACFEAVAELDETQQVAEALTRSVRFDGGDVADGTVAESDADEVTLIAPSIPTVMSPGQVSLMGFNTDSDDPADDPDFEATLMQFEGSKRHIRVGHAGRFEGKTGHFEHNFEVDEGVCDDLCNKEHSVAFTVALKLRDGRVSRRQRMDLTLDCRERGKPSACGAKPRAMGGGAGDDYYRACQNTIEYCSASDVGGDGDGDGVIDALNPSECAAEYTCMRSFFGEGSQCGDLLDGLASCMLSIESVNDCTDCYSALEELTSSCPEPTPCLEGGSIDRPDAGTVGPGPADGGVTPVGPPSLTDSLRENCMTLCEVSRLLGCSVTPTCEQECEGGLVGTACELAVVELQHCALSGLGIDQALACNLTEPMVDPTGACTAQIDAIGECLVANEVDPTPDPMSRDAGTPAP